MLFPKFHIEDLGDMHDGRLLTLDDPIEFFNLMLELKLTADEKADLVAFLRCLRLRRTYLSWH